MAKAPTIYCSEPASSGGNKQWVTVPPDHARRDATPAQAAFPEGDKHANIVVTISSYHDSWRCGHTIKDLFAKAKNRERIYVGIVDQTSGTGNDVGCISSYCVSLGTSCPSILQLAVVADTSDTLIF